MDRVIPMLPHALSNGICSLNAGVDRLALSCIMTVNPKGEIVDHEIAESVICVDERMSYTSVKKILEEQDPKECERYREFVPMFELMEELAGILRARRKKRGSIDFDFPETKMILDTDGHPIDIKPYDRNVATKIIEDFMLAANETVAEDYFWQEIPFVYRTHEAPDEEKMKKLATFINNFGHSIHIANKQVRPKEVQKLLAKVEGTPEETMISRLAPVSYTHLDVYKRQGEAFERAERRGASGRSGWKLYGKRRCEREENFRREGVENQSAFPFDVAFPLSGIVITGDYKHSLENCGTKGEVSGL